MTPEASPQSERKALVEELKITIEFLANRDQSLSEVFGIPHPTPFTDLFTRSLGFKLAVYKVRIDDTNMDFRVLLLETEEKGEKRKAWGVRVDNVSNGNIVDELVYKDWEKEDFVSLDPRDGGKEAPMEDLYFINYILSDKKRKREN